MLFLSFTDKFLVDKFLSKSIVSLFNLKKIFNRDFVNLKQTFVEKPLGIITNYFYNKNLSNNFNVKSIKNFFFEFRFKIFNTFVIKTTTTLMNYIYFLKLIPFNFIKNNFEFNVFCFYINVLSKFYITGDFSFCNLSKNSWFFNKELLIGISNSLLKSIIKFIFNFNVKLFKNSIFIKRFYIFSSKLSISLLNTFNEFNFFFCNVYLYIFSEHILKKCTSYMKINKKSKMFKFLGLDYILPIYLGCENKMNFIDIINLV